MRATPTLEQRTLWQLVVLALLEVTKSTTRYSCKVLKSKLSQEDTRPTKARPLPLTRALSQASDWQYWHFAFLEAVSLIQEQTAEANRQCKCSIDNLPAGSWN